MSEENDAEAEVQSGDDLYMLLNVDRSAGAIDIRTAYLTLALCLHPDKACNAAMQELSRQQQEGPALDSESRMAALSRVRRRADAQFVLVDHAYRVLSDPVKKQIYDEYGLDALRVFEQREKSKTSVGAPLKHPAQVRQLMDELLVESAQRRLEATPGMRGSISADCKFFPVIDTDGQLKPQNMVPDVTKLVIQQSVSVPIGDVSSISFGGYAVHVNGVGVGSTFVNWRHHYSPRRWIGADMSVGSKPKFTMSIGEMASKQGTTHQMSMTTGQGFKLASARQLNPTTVLNASLVTEKEAVGTVHMAKIVRNGFGKIRAEVQVSATDLGIRMSYQHFILSVARSLQMSVKLGTRGMQVEVGAKRVLPQQVKLISALRVGLEGITAVLRVQRAAMRLELPILVGTVATGWTIAVGGVIPAVVDAGVGWLMASSWRKRAARLRSEQEPMRRQQVLRALKNAASQTALMQRMAERNATEEQEKGGLVITFARYGCRLSQDCGARWWARNTDHTLTRAESEEVRGEDDAGAIDLLSAPNVNVTLPLQFFVRNSALTLPSASKSSMLGFYVPAPCRRSQQRRGIILTSLLSQPWQPVGEQGWSLDSEWFGLDGEGGVNRTLGEAGGGPVPPRLYVRYVFAGRVFEETFEDDQEVVLPSPTSTYMGGEDVR